MGAATVIVNHDRYKGAGRDWGEKKKWNDDDDDGERTGFTKTETLILFGLSPPIHQRSTVDI